MKIVSIFSSLILAIYAVIVLIWLWSDAISFDMFIKITATAAVILGVTIVVALVYREYVEEKDLKKNKYLD